MAVTVFMLYNESADHNVLIEFDRSNLDGFNTAGRLEIVESKSQ